MWPKFYQYTSGGEKHFIEVCRRWLAKGHEIHVLTTATGKKILSFNGLKIYCHVLGVPLEDALRKSSLGTAIFYGLRTLKACLLSPLSRAPLNFDVILCLSHFLYDLLPATFFCMRSNCKIVVYMHELPYLEHTPLLKVSPASLPSIIFWFSQQLSIALMRKYVHLIFANPLPMQELAAMKLSQARIDALHHAVDHSCIEKVTTFQENYDACFVGRISPVKGAFDLIEIWSKVCNKIPRAKIAVMGNQEHYVEEFLRRVKAANLEGRVVYLGPVNDVRKYSVLKGAKLFVFPSHWEGWGIAICEAMACSLPVVAYDLPLYTYVYKKGMVRVPPGDKDRFGEVIVELLSNDYARQKLGEEARDWVKRYDWDEIASREINAFAKLLAT